MPFLPLFPSPKIMLLSRPYLFLYCLEISPFIHIKLYFIGEGKFLLIFLIYQSQFSCDSSGAVLQSQKVRYEPVGQKNKKQNKTTATTKTKNTKHLTRIRIFFKTEIFFSPFQGLPPTRNRRFRAPKGHVLETVPREGRHFETISFVFTCGQTKTEVFE